MWSFQIHASVKVILLNLNTFFWLKGCFRHPENVRIEKSQGSRDEGGCESLGDERVFVLSFFLTSQMFKRFCIYPGAE